jgi:HicB family
LYTRNMARAPSPAPDLAPAYRVSVTRADDGANGGWLAEVEGLPECSARGETPEEAIARSMSTLTGRFPDGSVGGETKTEAMSRRSGRILVRMPVTLHDELAKAAGAEGVSLNQLITGFLAAAVAWRGGGEAQAGAKSTSTASATSARRGPESERLMRIALAVNLGAVVVAAIAAVVLIVLAWQHGW